MKIHSDYYANDNVVTEYKHGTVLEADDGRLYRIADNDDSGGIQVMKIQGLGAMMGDDRLVVIPEVSNVVTVR